MDFSRKNEALDVQVYDSSMIDALEVVQDQKVMWHAVPFEERLAQALATHEDPGLQR